MRVEPLATVAFPSHTDSSPSVPLPERLASGVSIVSSNVNAVFVSGASLTRFDREPDSDTLKAFQMYRPDRILVLAPSSSMDHARQLWSLFKGSDSREVGVARGRVSTGDLPALYVLKTLIDRKIIEAGWWREVTLRIDASNGSELQILADDGKRSTVVEWIKKIGLEKPSDTEMAWAREVAIHRFDTVRADIQALLWERDPEVSMQALETISAGHVSDVARIYF